MCANTNREIKSLFSLTNQFKFQQELKKKKNNQPAVLSFWLTKQAFIYRHKQWINSKEMVSLQKKVLSTDLASNQSYKDLFPFQWSMNTSTKSLATIILVFWSGRYHIITEDSRISSLSSEVIRCIWTALAFKAFYFLRQIIC